VDHTVAVATTVALLIALFALAGPVATLIANADETSIRSTITGLGVFLGYLLYRRIWELRRRS
jgi:hypothetical protein